MPRLFFIAIGLAVTGFFYLTYLQYILWRKSGPPAQYLVPPHRDIGYLFGYAIGHFAQSYLISLGAAFIFLGAAILLNEHFDGRFFEDEEPYFGALAIFLLGNPLWIYYLISIIFAALMVTGYRFLVSGDKFRFSLYYLWWPAAVIVFIISKITV